jgi:hypothetical protein
MRKNHLIFFAITMPVLGVIAFLLTGSLMPLVVSLFLFIFFCISVRVDQKS